MTVPKISCSISISYNSSVGITHIEIYLSLKWSAYDLVKHYASDKLGSLWTPIKYNGSDKVRSIWIAIELYMSSKVRPIWSQLHLELHSCEINYLRDHNILLYTILSKALSYWSILRGDLAHCKNTRCRKAKRMFPSSCTPGSARSWTDILENIDIWVEVREHRSSETILVVVERDLSTLFVTIGQQRD